MEKQGNRKSQGLSTIPRQTKRAPLKKKANIRGWNSMKMLQKRWRNKISSKRKFAKSLWIYLSNYPKWMRRKRSIKKWRGVLFFWAPAFGCWVCLMSTSNKSFLCWFKNIRRLDQIGSKYERQIHQKFKILEKISDKTIWNILILLLFLNIRYGYKFPTIDLIIMFV